MKLINIENSEILTFKNADQPSNQIESFISSKNIFIIVCTFHFIKSYIFNPLSISLYKEYIDKEESEHTYFEIFTHDDSHTKVIDSDNSCVIRIWDFNSCDLLHTIKVTNNYIDFCLYNNYLLFLQIEGLKVMDIECLKNISFYVFSNNWKIIISIEHFKYGKYLLYKEGNFIGYMSFK